MKDLLRALVAAVVGAVVALAVVVGQPALAHQVDKAKAKKVTSAQIKNGTIKTKDLSAEVTGPLAKAGTALQSIPDAGVTTSKLANSSVTSSKLADGSVTTTKLADSSVTGAKITDHSVKIDDLSQSSGDITLDPGTILLNQCTAANNIETGHVVTGDVILVSQPTGVVGALSVTGRESAGGSTKIDIVICNIGTASFDPPSATYNWVVIGY